MSYPSRAAVDDDGYALQGWQKLLGRADGEKCIETGRQWLEIHEQAGTQTQLKVFVDMADSKLLELQDQEQQLKQTIEDLKGLRQQTLQEMNKFSK